MNLKKKEQMKDEYEITKEGEDYLSKKIMETDDIMFKEKDNEIKELKSQLKKQKKLEREIKILKGKLKIARYNNKELLKKFCTNIK